MYLCNVQHCIYKVHLDTGFSSNTETTINRSDITVFFFCYVFKMTQKCIFNNIQFKQIIPTTVDTQAKLFKCTMIDLRSRKGPGSPCNSTPGTHWPITCTSFCVLSRSVRSQSPTSNICPLSQSPSSWHRVRATQIHQESHTQTVNKVTLDKECSCALIRINTIRINFKH